MAFKVINCTWLDWSFKRSTCTMQDIWTLEKHCIWSGIVYSDQKWHKQHGDFFMGSKRSKSDYLSVFRTVCCLANFVYSLFNGKRFRWWVWACWSPLSSTDPNNIGQIMENSPAMYNCVKCVFICVTCKFDGLILMVSVDFKNIGTMFTQRGEVCNQVNWCHFRVGANLDLAFGRTK